MKLYYSPGACSLAPHIALAELGTAYEVEKVSMRDKDSLKRIHPKAYVPMLRMDSGEILSECAAILQYVADQRPEANLLPKFGTLARYRALEWLNFTATEIHKGFGTLFVAEILVPEEKACAEFKARIKTRLSERLDWVDQQLAGKEFILGQQFGVCDAYLFTCISWGKYVDVDTSGWKNISAWSARVYARPAVQKVMRDEGLLK